MEMYVGNIQMLDGANTILWNIYQQYTKNDF